MGKPAKIWVNSNGYNAPLIVRAKNQVGSTVSIDSKLLEILRCPVTKQPLSILSKEQLDTINQAVSSGKVHYADGAVVDSELEDGLITKNGNWIYRIDSGIPIMLQAQSIAASEVDWAGAKREN